MQERLALPVLVLILSASVQGGLLDVAVGGLGNTVGSATSAVGNTVGSLGSTVGDTVSTVGDAAGNTLGEVANAVENGPRYIKDYSSRTMGGEIAIRGEIDFQAQILLKNVFYCGGALLGAQWVVTTASCADPNNQADMTIAFNKLSNSGDEEGSIVRNVVAIRQHPQFRYNAFPNDIALIKLATPFEFDRDSKVYPVLLGTSGYTPYDDDNATVSGWGSSATSGGQPLQLHKVVVQIVGDTECNEAYESKGVTIADSMICAGQIGKSPCQGDSGGPLTAIEPEEHGRSLVGVLSWGQGCGQVDYPAVYTKVTKYVDWIRSITVYNQ